MTIAGHIAKVIAAGGARVAIDFGGETLSWAALGEGIAAVRSLLDAAGLGARVTAIERDAREPDDDEGCEGGDAGVALEQGAHGSLLSLFRAAAIAALP